MITLAENMVHQVTMIGTGLLAEARTGQIDCTGLKLLDAPHVELHDDGSITLLIAVVNPTKTPPKRGKLVSEESDE
jgi:hypothetical protein